MNCKVFRWLMVSFLMFLVPCLNAQMSQTHFYGPGIAMDSLGNLKLGPTSGGFTEMDYRFRAQYTTIDGVWAYLITSGSGYAGGTGGTVVLQLTTDDGTINHLPTSTVLRSASLVNALNAPSFHPFTFSSYTLTPGTIYHLVWSNSDPNPATNYISLDFIDQQPGTSPAQATIRPEDFDVFGLSGSTWIEQVPPNTFNNQAYIPVANILYNDTGTPTQGLGYIEILDRGTIGGTSGTSAVREAFTVSGSNRTVVRVSARARRTTGTAELHIHLETSSGTAIDDCYVPSSSFPLNVDTFVTCAFTSAHALTSGSSYNLVLEASSGTTYDTFPLENAAKDSWNFGAGTTFPDGEAQWKVNGGAWTEWDGNRTDTDLQFYFTLQ